MANYVDIILPEGQLEGTSAILANWLVKEGDSVKNGDPIAELETDKVVMEVCALASGTIASLDAKVGDSVATEQVLGKIDEQSLTSNGLTNEADLSRQQQPSAQSSTQPSTNGSAPHDSKDAVTLSNPVLEGQADSQITQSQRKLISPAVRRLIQENDLQLEPIRGTGKGGRITRDDVLAYLKNPQAFTAHIASSVSVSQVSQSPYSIIENRPSRQLVGNKIKHSQMRKSIASHMVESLLHTSPHVTSVFEMDMTNLIEHRKWHKKEYADMGVKLTFTAYFLAAMAKAIRVVPQVNARFHEDALEVFDDVNVGVGTALGDAGLVVPVVEQVQAMTLFEIAYRLNQQTEKARKGKLTPADMRNGTITISNHGVSGSLFAAPIIINQPEVAILGIGKLEKRVVVESINGEDQMVIRPKCYVSLSIDHRALDAHQTNQFLTAFVDIIENWGQ
ncbi:dihydrolipoamide acetyltransferase family protein [Aliikangiella maris]|uniref:Dihydrolipoamide acetyltransferase component of pyruvate dehydrogenase complex n=2 Tax=Aliikangiella maris TaxID=3162458 RepID=A0ABV3MJU0_9GAMM